MSPSSAARDAALERTISSHITRGEQREAATEAIQGYGPEILALLRAQLNDEDSVREVFARFSERLWRGISGFRGECKFKTWALAIALNVCRRYRRDPFRRRRDPLSDEHLHQIAHEVTESALTALSMEARLARLRDRLDPDERMLLVLRIDERMAWRDVAKVLSAPGRALDEVTVRNRFQRLKAKLRRLAAKDGSSNDPG